MRSIDADTLWRKMEDSPWNDNADRDLAQEMVLSMPTLTTPTIGHCKNCDNWDEDFSAGRKSLGNYVCYCHEWGDPEIGFCRFTSPNDYCSYFEPKEEMEDDSNKDGSLVTNCFPNEPLTLEQLRQMDGQPVWVEDVEHWALIDIEKGGQWDGMPFATWQKNGVRFCYNVINRKLLCYRHPPEEEEDT